MFLFISPTLVVVLFKASTILPVLMAQLDMPQTDDQEVASLTPAGMATFFHGD